MKLSEFVEVCSNKKELEEYQKEHAGDIVFIYIPKVSDDEDKEKRNEEIKKAIKLKIPINKIASLYGITRQQIWNIKNNS